MCPYPWVASVPTCWDNIADSRRCGDHAGLVILVQPPLHVKPPQSVSHICIWVHGLKYRHIQVCNSKMLFASMPPLPMLANWHFTHHGKPIRVNSSLLRRGWRRVFLLPTTGWTLGGLPHGLAVADLADLLPPLSSTDPSLW